MEAVLGKNLILLWRLLEDATTSAGAKLAFQTEHSVSVKRSADTTETKDGPLVTGGGLEEEIPFNCIMAKDDPVVAMLQKALRENKVLEQWEVDITKATANKYPATYRQGLLSELEKSANTEDLVELSGTFVVNGLAQTGEVELTAEQAEVVQYVFRDTAIVTAP